MLIFCSGCMSDVYTIGWGIMNGWLGYGLAMTTCHIYHNALVTWSIPMLLEIHTKNNGDTNLLFQFLTSTSCDFDSTKYSQGNTKCYVNSLN